MKSTSQQKFHPRPTALAASALVGALMLTACGGGDGDGVAIDTGIDNTLAQPVISAQVKSVLTVEGKQFKDSNGNGQLDPYEDWRRPVDQRVDDLVGKMTLEEKAGLMLIDTLNAGCGGAVHPTASDYVNTQKMSRFILRNVVTAHALRHRRASRGHVRRSRRRSSPTRVQAMAEATRLGIPAVFKSNARNHL